VPLPAGALRSSHRAIPHEIHFYLHDATPGVSAVVCRKSYRHVEVVVQLVRTPAPVTASVSQNPQASLDNAPELLKSRSKQCTDPESYKEFSTDAADHRIRSKI
jgi:hypothetical protein